MFLILLEDALSVKGGVGVPDPAHGVLLAVGVAAALDVEVGSLVELCEELVVDFHAVDKLVYGLCREVLNAKLFCLRPRADPSDHARGLSLSDVLK